MKNKLFFVLIILALFSGKEILAEEDIEEPQATPVVQEATAQPIQVSTSPKIGGQNKISLDIKGMDIIDVLKMLAMRSGINIVVGKNVTGRVTLFLKDVDVWDAFEIVLLANDLAYEKKGEIINVMTQRDYELLHGERYQDKKQVKIVPLKYAKAADLSRALNQIKTNLGRIVADEGSNTIVLIDVPEKINEMMEFIKNTDLPIQTRVFSLNYAPVDKLSTKLQEAITKGIGSIKIDERTNKIVVTDYPQKLDEIAKIVSAFDEKSSQVLIDAQIIEIRPSDKFQMGVDWDYWIRKYFEFKTNLALNTDNVLFIGTRSTAPAEKGEYKAIIDILRTIGDTKVLSSPRIMVVNNQEAKIHVGTKEAYITSTTTQGASGNTVTSQTVNFVDTGIQLLVTPTINRDGFVTMKIKPEISDAESRELLSQGQKTTVPIVSTSEAETTVTVKDGITIIIGGLRKDKREKTVRKIPLLGDIPGLGFVFRSTSDNLTKTDLVILLTPHIMSGESSYTAFSEIPPKEGAVARMERGNIVTEKIFLSKQEESIRASIPDKKTEYYQLVTDKIQKFAKLNSPRKRKGEVNLEFSVLNNGKVAEEPTVVGATDSSLVPYALKAIKDASPFPPFSKFLEKERETFKISLSYE